MSLKTPAANRKDTRTARNGVTLEHRHFSFIADVLLHERPSADCATKRAEWDHIVQVFADRCRSTNPRFDRVRFVAACEA